MIFSILYLFSDINKSSSHLMNKGDVFYSSSVQISRRQIKLLVIVSSLILKSVHITMTSVSISLLNITYGNRSQMYLVFSFCIFFLHFFWTWGTELRKMVVFFFILFFLLLNNTITGMINNNVN